MTLDEARGGIGRWVVYAAYPGAEDEFGVIIHVGDLYAFVRYGDDPYPKATRPESIEFPVVVT